MRIWQRMLLVLTAFIFLAGCNSHQVTGNGRTATKMRVVDAFNEIQVSGAYRVKVIEGDAPSVKITTDANIIPLVITEVKENKLRIHNKKDVSFSLTQPVLIQVVVKKLKQVTASGANQLTLSKINTDHLALNTNGSVQAELSGQVDELTMSIAGAGNINARNLIAKDIQIRMMGSGEVIANATNKLDTKITGSGTVKYLGNPDSVNQSIIGSGTLERIK